MCNANLISGLFLTNGQKLARQYRCVDCQDPLKRELLLFPGAIEQRDRVALAAGLTREIHRLSERAPAKFLNELGIRRWKMNPAFLLDLREQLLVDRRHNSRRHALAAAQLEDFQPNSAKVAQVISFSSRSSRFSAGVGD